jgi:signal transduction histidine kinase
MQASLRKNKTHLIILNILAGIIGVSVLGALTLYKLQLDQQEQLVQQAMDNFKADLTEKSFYVSELASQHITSIERVTQILPKAKSFQTGEYDRIRILLDAAKLDASENVDSYFILDKDGVLRYSTDPLASNLVGTSMSGHEVFVQTKESQKSYVSPLSPSLVDDSLVFYIASPIIDSDTGEFKGTVSAAIRADTFAKSVEKLVLAGQDIDSSSLSLIDPSGSIMYAGASQDNLGKNVLSDEVLGTIPSGIKEGFTASLKEAISGKFGIYEINLREHPELAGAETPQGRPIDYVLFSYRPVKVDDQTVMISFVTKSASIENALRENGVFQTSYMFYFYYAIMATLIAFAAAIIIINRRLARTVEKKTTELQKTNDDLIKIASQLAAQEIKLRESDVEKEEFSAMITHELKTPLVPIIGYSELLLDGTLGELNDKQKKKIQIMHSSAVSLSRLISDLLDVRKLELGKMKFEMNEAEASILIGDCIDILKTSAEAKEITLTSNITEDKIVTWCDAKRINQVMRNLVSNAIKFVPAKTGKVELYAEKNEAKEVVFSIKDNGVGIPKEKQRYIFQKFYQADTSMTRNAGGTGLGLAICKGIVEAHGGKIWFDSGPGTGTAFYFTLPSKPISSPKETSISNSTEAMA